MMLLALLVVAPALAWTLDDYDPLPIYLADTQVLAGLQQASPEWETCIGRTVPGEIPDDGELGIEFSVTREGSPTRIRLLDPGATDPALQACVVNVVSGIRFAPHLEQSPTWRYVVAWRGRRVVPYPTIVQVPRAIGTLFLVLAPDLSEEAHRLLTEAVGFDPIPASKQGPDPASP